MRDLSRTRPFLEAMRQVPREAFVAPGCEDFAYEDGPLPIGEGQTILRPYVVALVALMIEAAELEPGDRVLEVGAGSGYAAAVPSRTAARVHAIERHPGLADAVKRRRTEPIPEGATAGAPLLPAHQSS
jgi:protein-L-isoaspartate O-methyltransferase